MSLDRSELQMLQTSYAKLGLDTSRRLVVDKVESSSSNYRLANNLKQTLVAIDSLIRLDMERSNDNHSRKDTFAGDVDDPLEDFSSSAYDQVSRNISEAFRAYNSAITEFMTRSRNGGVDPKLREVFVKTGNFLTGELEPLLADKDKKSLVDLKPLHSIVTQEYYSNLIFKPPGLQFTDAYSEYNDYIDADFLQEFYKRMGDYCQTELFPQILDHGYSLPQRIVCDLQHDDIVTLEYSQGTPRQAEQAFCLEFHDQFINKLYDIGSELFRERDVNLLKNQAIKERLLNLTLIAVSPESLSSMSKASEGLRASLEKTDLWNIADYIGIDGFKLNPLENLRYSSYLSLFKSAQNVISNFIDEYKDGVLLSRGHSEMIQHLRRATALIGAMLGSDLSRQNPDSEFDTVVLHKIGSMGATIQKIADILEKYCGKNQDQAQSKTSSLAESVLWKLINFIYQDGNRGVIKYFNLGGDDLDLTQSQLEELTLNDTDRDDFCKLFDEAMYSVINKMLLSIDPLELRNLACVYGDIKILSVDNGVNDNGAKRPEVQVPCMQVHCLFKDSDEEYGEHFLQRHSEVISTALDEANEIFAAGIRDAFGEIDWSLLEKETVIPINIGFDLSGLSTASPAFSVN